MCRTLAYALPPIHVMGSLIRKNRQTPPRTMAPDRSRSSMSGSPRAPPASPPVAPTGAGSSCVLSTLKPIRSASQRQHFSDLRTMVGADTETFMKWEALALGLASWPFGRAIHDMG